MCFIMKTLLETRIKTKEIYRILEFIQLQWLKRYIEFNTKNGGEAEKHNDKDGKALYKFMSNAIYEKLDKLNLQRKINVHPNEVTCRTKYLTII